MTGSNGELRALRVEQSDIHMALLWWRSHFFRHLFEEEVRCWQSDRGLMQEKVQNHYGFICNVEYANQLGQSYVEMSVGRTV